MSITTNGMIILIIPIISSVYFTMALPLCNNCDLGCNNTDIFTDDNMNSSEIIDSNRIRRRSLIEQRSCDKFQLELILIPLSVALIPFGLVALLVCACYCGPKESRGKMPESFEKKKAKIYAKDANEIDNDELTYKNGVIMRKDSKKIRFSTTISFIEANSINDEIAKNDQSIIPDALLFSASKTDEAKYFAKNDQTLTLNDNNQITTTIAIKQVLMNEMLANKIENDTLKSDRKSRQITSKQTRFSNDVSVSDGMLA